MIGLNPNEIEKIKAVFSKFNSVSSVIVFGSRAKGTHKPASDIDLAVKGNGINLETLNELSIQLDDLLLPYKFDISIYSNIENQNLLDHIIRVGKIIYERTN